MTISVGEALPEADLLRIGAEGPETVAITDHVAGKTVAIFGVPGAFTSTCTSAHVPSFIRTKDGFAEKGVSEIICVSVNDPFVMQAWGDATGATEAGLTMLSDPSGAFVKAMGLDFTAPPVGFFGRSRRFTMLVEDGKVKVVHEEENPGVCETTAGETLLAEV